MATYTYTIEGRTFRSPKQLSDAELEELTASLKQPPPAADKSYTYQAVGSQGQPITGISTEPVTNNVPTEEVPLVSTSSFVRGLKDPISAGAQLLPRALSTATSLGGIVPNMFSKWFDTEAKRVDEMVKAEEQQYQQQRQLQNASGIDWGRIAGNIINPATLGVAGSVTRLLPTANLVTSGAVAGGATGLLQPVTEGDFAEEKTKQGLSGVIGGAVGSAATAGAGRVLNPLVSKAEQTMRDLNVAMTPGQMLGGQAKAFEEFAQNLPLIGRYISDAKQRALFSFNKGVINKALTKVGEKLPEDVIGRDAVQYADDVISKKYDDVLSTISFKMDSKAFQDIANALQTKPLPSPQQNQVVDSLLDSIVYSKLPQNSTVPGQAFKDIESDLRKTASDYINSNLASDRQIGKALEAVSKSLKKTLASQNPTQSSILRRIDNAYGDVVIMRTAAANSGAVNGVFTPVQYKTAVRQRDVTRNKTAFAAGRARGQDIADDAVEILGRDPSSTLEGRLATQVGGGLAALASPSVAVPVAIAAPVMYSETGIKVMTALMRNRPDVARKVGEILTSRANKEGSITGTQIIKEYNRLTKTEND